MTPAGKAGHNLFEHVNYRYHGAEKLALEDIDFSAKSGETVAIIGGTGSGKSTLVNLSHDYTMSNQEQSRLMV